MNELNLDWTLSFHFKWNIDKLSFTEKTRDERKKTRDSSQSENYFIISSELLISFINIYLFSLSKKISSPVSESFQGLWVFYKVYSQSDENSFPGNDRQSLTDLEGWHEVPKRLQLYVYIFLHRSFYLLSRYLYIYSSNYLLYILILSIYQCVY